MEGISQCCYPGLKSWQVFLFSRSREQVSLNKRESGSGPIWTLKILLKKKALKYWNLITFLTSWWLFWRLDIVLSLKKFNPHCSHSTVWKCNVWVFLAKVTVYHICFFPIFPLLAVFYRFLSGCRGSWKLRPPPNRKQCLLVKIALNKNRRV